MFSGYAKFIEIRQNVLIVFINFATSTIVHVQTLLLQSVSPIPYSALYKNLVINTQFDVIHTGSTDQ